MKLVLTGIFCVLGVGIQLAWGNTYSSVQIQTDEQKVLLQEIVELVGTVPDEGDRYDLLPALAVGQTQAGQLQDALSTYHRWVDLGNSFPPSPIVNKYTRNDKFLAQVEFLSNLGHHALHGRYDDWGRERFDEALQLVEKDSLPWNRVAGYRIIIEKIFPLGLSVYEPLQRMRREVENWPVNEIDPVKVFHGTYLVLDALAVELLVNDKVATARAFKKAFELIYPSNKKHNTFLLRKVAVLQAHLGRHTEARENMKKVFDLRKPFEHIDFDKWEPEARYVWDLCDLANAQVELGEKEHAQETLSLAFNKIQEYPNHLDIFQMAWQSLSITATRLGNETLREEAEWQIRTPRLKNSSNTEWILFLTEHGQEDKALHYIRSEKTIYDFDYLVKKLAKKKRFSTIVNLIPKPQSFQMENSCQILSYAIAQENGLEEAHKWVIQIPNSFLKVHGLLGILDWLSEKIDME